MNTENSKTNESHRFKLDLTDKLNNMALASLSNYYTWKNIKSEQKKNKFKISASIWNDTFGLPNGSYSVSDIQGYFEFIIKKHETLTENPPIQIYSNKIKNIIVFKIKTGYRLKLLTPETMKLLGSKKKMLIEIKIAKMYQNQNLLRLFQYIVIQSKMIVNIQQTFYLVLFRINNLDS